MKKARKGSQRLLSDMSAMEVKLAEERELSIRRREETVRDVEEARHNLATLPDDVPEEVSRHAVAVVERLSEYVEFHENRTRQLDDDRQRLEEFKSEAIALRKRIDESPESQGIAYLDEREMHFLRQVIESGSLSAVDRPDHQT